MLNDKNHFWFSKKQRTYMVQDCIRKGVLFKPLYSRINGKKLEYTLMNSVKEHCSNWDDMVYLGYGDYLGY